MIDSGKPGDIREHDTARIVDVSSGEPEAPENAAAAVRRRQNAMDRDAETIRAEIMQINDRIAALQEERTRLVRDLAAVWTRG